MKRTHPIFQFHKKEPSDSSSQSSSIFRNFRISRASNRPSRPHSGKVHPSLTPSPASSISTIERPPPPPPEPLPSSSRGNKAIYNVFIVGNGADDSRSTLSSSKSNWQRYIKRTKIRPSMNLQIPGRRICESRETLSSHTSEDGGSESPKRNGANNQPVVVTVEGTNSSASGRIPEIATNDHCAELTRNDGESFFAFHKRTFGLRLRVKLGGFWEAVKKKKKELDDWNPNMNHPLVKCIHESKMAGLKETIKPNKGIVWRVSWFLAWLTALLIGLILSANALGFQFNFPLLFGLRIKPVATNLIPDPTIAVCPFYSFKPKALDDLEKFLKEVEMNEKQDWKTEDVMHLMNHVDHICRTKSTLAGVSGNEESFKSRFYKKLLYKFEKSNNLTSDQLKKIRHYIEKMSLELDEFIQHCEWNGKSVTCSKLFKPKLTNHGICYIFNAMPATDLYSNEETQKFKGENDNSTWDDWNLDNHNFEGNGPKRRKGPESQPTGGRPWGLKFLVRTGDKFSGECDQFDGFGPRIYMNVPGVDGDIKKLNVAIPPNQDVTFKMYPDLVLAESEISNIPIEIRRCVFQNELKLTYYKSYTQENCQRECLANFTSLKCECALLSYPNVPGKQLCITEVEIECARSAENKLFSEQTRLCAHCIPTCNQMSIFDQMYTAPLSREAKERYSGEGNESFSLVDMFYVPDNVMPKERSRRFSDYEKITVVGSIFESTNDLSGLGIARVFVGLNALLPAIQTLLEVGVKKIIKIIMKFRDAMMRLFLRNEGTMNPIPIVRRPDINV